MHPQIRDVRFYTYTFVFVITEFRLTEFKEVRFERLALAISKTKIATQRQRIVGLRKKN